MPDPKSRYGFPPLPDRIAYPAEPPLSTPIAELASFWLLPGCCSQRTTHLPCRWLAAQHGWHWPLSVIIASLRCKCGKRPATVTLVDRPDRMGSHHGGGSDAWTMELPIRSPENPAR